MTVITGTVDERAGLGMLGKLMGFGCHLSCHWWQPMFFKGIQWGAINLSRVMHRTEVTRSYEGGWTGGGGKTKGSRVSVTQGGRGGLGGGGGLDEVRDEQSGDIKRQMQRRGQGQRREWCRVDPTRVDDVPQVTHHESQVVKAIDQELALVLRQPHVLQPLSHRLVQGSTAGPICREREALQQWEAVQPVAAALRGRHMALPHHPRPAEAEPSAAAPGGVGGRQGPGRGWGGSHGTGGGPAKLKHGRKDWEVLRGPAQALLGGGTGDGGDWLG